VNATPTNPEPEDALTPEQEEMAQKFAAELEVVGGGQIVEDDDGKWWFTFGDFSVPVTPEQQEEFANTLYQAGLAKARSMAPTPLKPEVRAVGIALTVGFIGVVAWGLAKLFGLL
jgi:hypothetical protein